MRPASWATPSRPTPPPPVAAAQTIVGTPYYVSSEVALGQPYGFPADVYALGACLYTFVFGRIPFTAATVAELFDVVQGTALAFPPDVPASPALLDLLSGLLEKVGLLPWFRV